MKCELCNDIGVVRVPRNPWTDGYNIVPCWYCWNPQQPDREQGTNQ
jgi:hypothetical protein